MADIMKSTSRRTRKPAPASSGTKQQNRSYRKVTDDVSKVSQDDAALVLKTFLLSKIKEDEE